MPERDDLDQLIDTALGTYAEPRRGIEQRILARIELVRSEHPALRRRWLVWAVAIPLAACIVLYVAISVVRSPQGNKVQQVPRQEQASVPPTQNSYRESPPSVGTPRKTESSLIRHRGTNTPVTTADMPKLTVFPAPQPLTAEEQALVALAAEPAEVRQQVLAKPAHYDAPLQISAIQISPIPLLEAGKN